MKLITSETAGDNLCSVCHLELKPEYYFCPNCGTKVIVLSTDVWTQIKLYTFSIVLPFIAFIAISRWYAPRYIRSKDAKKQVVGWIAMSLLVLSTLSGIWYTYVAVRNATVEASKDVNELLGQ